MDDVQKLLEQARIETDEAKRTEMYQEANRQIMTILPGVPYAHNEAGGRLPGERSRLCAEPGRRTSRSRPSRWD